MKAQKKKALKTNLNKIWKKRKKPFIILFFFFFPNSKIKGVFKSNLLFHLFLSLQETTVISIIHIFLKTIYSNIRNKATKRNLSNKFFLKKKKKSKFTHHFTWIKNYYVLLYFQPLMTYYENMIDIHIYILWYDV